MSVETQKIEGERQRYREKDKQAKDAETEADRQEMEAPPPQPRREMGQTETWKRGTRRVKSPGIRPEVDGQSKHSQRGTKGSY